MKKKRVSGADRIQYFTQQNIIKQMGILTDEEKEELNKQMDEIDKLPVNEQPIAIMGVKAWLQNKWNKYNEPICVKCNRKETCKRQQTVKKCKFYEGSEE